jgi:hypothetical protein
VCPHATVDTEVTLLELAGETENEEKGKTTRVGPKQKQTAGMEAADRCSKTTTAKENSTRCREKQKTPTKKYIIKDFKKNTADAAVDG